MGRAKLWVQIMHDNEVLPRDLIHVEQVMNGLDKRSFGLEVIKVAQMLTDQDLTINHQGNRILQVTPQGEDWLRCRQLANGSRCKTTTTANHQRTVSPHGDHRIIHTPGNRTLTNQQRISQSFQLVNGVIVAKRDRFARTITTRQHQRTGCSCRE